jgi:hypothetical protein
VTDGWQGYHSLQKEGYHHIVKLMKENQDLLPHVHLVFSLIKRWILGTYQGSIKTAYLDFYLDEFTYHFNRRK